RLLAQHPWRGNVRELEAVLEQAMIFRGGDWITPEDLDLLTPRSSELESKAGGENHKPAASDEALSWLQHEAVRLAAGPLELRRRECIARFHISREIARRELAGLVARGLLRLIGRGRGARYVPLSFWLTWIGDVLDWAIVLAI